MKRNRFLKHLLGSAATLGLGKEVLALSDPPVEQPMTQPPFLRPGDTIGITCPASPLELRQLQACQQQLLNWGFEVCVGNTVGQQWQRFGGSDADRAADLQLMLNDPSIKAILFARGGYGVMRMMDRIDWSALKRYPKWLVGYSDLTAIHCHVQSFCGMPSIHGEMVISFKGSEDPATRSLYKALSGAAIDYKTPPHPFNRIGHCSAKLVGGNLSLIVAMMGSASELHTDGRILFIEEVSEYKYTLDRMMITLKRAGKLDKLAGLVIGGITAVKTDNETQFQSTVEEIILEKVSQHQYPVCFNFPAGHIRQNLALKLGITYNLAVTAEGGRLTEIHANNPLFPPTQILDSIPLPSRNFGT